MKQIPLTQNQFALVDDEDYDYLNQWKWYAGYSQGTNSFYALRVDCSNGKPKTLSMHRAILNITDRENHVDHINHNTLDNRRSNIRIATYAQNCANRRSRKNSTSRFLGVYWEPNCNKWRSQIARAGKKYHLGSFDNEHEAANAYDKMALQIHGEFANLNFKTD